MISKPSSPLSTDRRQSSRPFEVVRRSVVPCSQVPWSAIPTLPPKPSLTTTMFEDTIKLIRSHDAQLAAFKLECIREWLPLFENFGRVSYAQGSLRQVTIQATLNSGVAGVFNVDEARRVYEGVLGFANGFSSWCDDLIRVINTSAAFAYFQPIRRDDEELERHQSRRRVGARARAQGSFSRPARVGAFHFSARREEFRTKCDSRGDVTHGALSRRSDGDFGGTNASA